VFLDGLYHENRPPYFVFPIRFFLFLGLVSFGVLLGLGGFLHSNASHIRFDPVEFRPFSPGILFFVFRAIGVTPPILLGRSRIPERFFPLFLVFLLV